MGNEPVPARLQPGEAHSLVHRLERRCRRSARLLGAVGEQPPQLRLVRADLLVAPADRIEYRDSIASNDSPVATDMISIRFEIPGFASRSWRTSRPESVTALLTFLRITSGGSAIRTVPCGVPSVVDIFRRGSCRSMIRAPIVGKRPSGTRNVSP